MTNSFTLKKAEPNDVPLLLSLIKDLAEYEKLPHEVTATEELLAEALFGKIPRAAAIIGYLEENPVSFAIYFYNFSTFLSRPGIYLEDLYVKPEARGKGIASKILTYLAKLAKEQGCGRMEWSVLDWNTPAINFYKNIGAVPMDEWTVYRLSGEALDKLAEK